MSGIVREIVVVNGNVELQQCGLYLTHKHALIEGHHVVPESWWVHANIPVASEIINICPNCHYSIHVGIDALIKKENIDVLPKKCKVYAQEAITQALAIGLTPTQTL